MTTLQYCHAKLEENITTLLDRLRHAPNGIDALSHAIAMHRLAAPRCAFPALQAPFRNLLQQSRLHAAETCTRQKIATILVILRSSATLDDALDLQLFEPEPPRQGSTIK